MEVMLYVVEGVCGLAANVVDMGIPVQFLVQNDTEVYMVVYFFKTFTIQCVVMAVDLAFVGYVFFGVKSHFPLTGPSS